MTKEEYKEAYKSMMYDCIEILGTMRKIYPNVYHTFSDDIRGIEEKIYELQFKFD